MTNNIFLSLKAQDRIRQWFSQRGSKTNPIITNLVLGDSDVDYELSQQINNIKILPAPYNISQIKYPMIYQGELNNVTATLETYIRHINSAGEIEALYNYPNLTFVEGQLPPTVSMNKDFNSLAFTPLTEGYIIFPVSLPLNYLDVNGNQMRFKEPYDIFINNLPPTLTISNIQVTSLNTTITTSIPHNLVNGDIVVVKNVVEPTNTTPGLTLVNGTFSIKNKTTNTFDLYTVDGSTAVLASGTYYGGGTITTWEFLNDITNYTFMISKTACSLRGLDGTITIKGKLTGNKKIINFNY